MELYVCGVNIDDEKSQLDIERIELWVVILESRDIVETGGD